MLISYDNPFLFIHTPKTGGTSITNALTKYALDPRCFWENRLLESIGIRVNEFTHYKRKRFRSHCSALDVRRNLPRSVYDSLFKFAFVRNPWDLLVSLYAFYGTRKTYRYQEQIAAMSFREFVEAWIVKSSTQQRRQVCDRQGNLIVDYIGYFEDLDGCFAHVVQKLGIQATLPHDNRSKHRDYREFYDRALMIFVQDKLAADIDLFEYEFDGTTGNVRGRSVA